LKQTNAHTCNALSASNASISILQFYQITYHKNACDNTCDTSYLSDLFYFHSSVAEVYVLRAYDAISVVNHTPAF